QLGGDELQGHGAVERLVDRLVDDAHAAAAHEPLEAGAGDHGADAGVEHGSVVTATEGWNNRPRVWRSTPGGPIAGRVGGEGSLPWTPAFTPTSSASTSRSGSLSPRASASPARS